MNTTFFETPAFTRHLSSYMSDDEYRVLQYALMENPVMGEMIQGTGGFRKLSWRDPRRRKGKRGGLRIIYYHFMKRRQIWFFALYDKDETDDLTIEQKRAMKKAIEIEKKERKAI